MEFKMKKKVLIGCLVVILLIIGIIFIMTFNKTSNINNIYKMLMNSKEYSFIMQKDDNHKIIMAKKGDDLCIDMYEDDEHNTTLIKDKQTYFIEHSEQVFYQYDSNEDIESNVVTEELENIAINKPEYKTGNEIINGTKYKYEEYENFSAFLMTISDINEENIKTRFYFDNKGNLLYIKTISETQEELLSIKILLNTEDSLFEIPNGYTKV